MLRSGVNGMVDFLILFIIIAAALTALFGLYLLVRRLIDRVRRRRYR